MSLHYILDGYNVLHKFSFPESANLEQQRDILICFLQERRPQGSSNNEVTIVFDGQPEHYGSGAVKGAIRVIFTEGESADEKIKKMVADAGAKGHIVVVTDDRGIRLSIRSDGVKVLSVKEFVNLRPASRSSTVKSSGKTLTPQALQKIDEELKKIWLERGNL